MLAQVPQVRMYAALVLERLAEAGEDAKFTDDPVTHAYRKLLEVERNKDVRKCVLGAMVIVAGTTVVVRLLIQLDVLIPAELLGSIPSPWHARLLLDRVCEKF